MKSLIQNNFMNSGRSDSIAAQGHETGFDAGRLSRSLGKNDTATKSGPNFQDLFMDALHAERNAQQNAPALKAPKLDLNNKTEPPKSAIAPKELSAKVAAPDKHGADRKTDAMQVKTEGTKPTALESKSNTVKEKDVDAVERNTSQGTVPKKDSLGASPAASVAAELRPLKMAVGNKNSAEALASNNAVLSFITGRLDRLEPDSIPSIITGNPFIKQAAASGEVSEFMQMPMSIADLCKMFEIDQSVMNKAAANGLDTNLKVTPKDFLAAIGVDPGSAIAELSLLQQRLPTEGVKSYIERAKAMAAEASMKAKGLADTAGQAATNSLEAVNSLQIPLTENTSKNQNENPNTSAQAGAIAAASITPTGLKSNAHASQISDVEISSARNAQGKSVSPLDSFGKPQKSRSVDLIESILADRSDLSVSVNTPEALERSNPAVLNTDLKNVSAAKVDPFAQMGQIMNPYSVQSTNFKPTTVSASMTSLEEQMAANGFQIKDMKDLGATQITSQDLRDLSLDKNELKTKSTDIFDLLEHTQSTNSLTAPTLEVKGLPESGLFSGNFTGSSGEQQGFEEDTSGSELLSEKLGSIGLSSSSVSGPAEKGEIFATKLNETKAPEQTSASELNSKILKHASLMLKDGGGAMKMDFQHPAMGKIDLAINLANNQLDVRILTANDQSRDIINKELAGLRDGLGQQGISLRTVEVGNTGQASQQFAGQNFAQGRQGQQASYNEMKEYAKSFANSFTSKTEIAPRLDLGSIRTPAASAWMNTSRDSSRIAVRI